MISPYPHMAARSQQLLIMWHIICKKTTFFLDKPNWMMSSCTHCIVIRSCELCALLCYTFVSSCVWKSKIQALWWRLHLCLTWTACSLKQKYMNMHIWKNNNERWFLTLPSQQLHIIFLHNIHVFASGCLRWVLANSCLVLWADFQREGRHSCFQQHYQKCWLSLQKLVWMILYW